MTSISNNAVWTPDLVAQDRALKEKYGPAAHIIPATESDYYQKGLQVPTMKNDLPTDVVELNKQNKDECNDVNKDKKQRFRLPIFKIRNIMDMNLNPADPASPLYNPAMDPGNVVSPMHPFNLPK